MAEASAPKYVVATINLVVFNTGEVAMRYENLGPVEFVRVLLGVVIQVVSNKFDPKQIVSENEIPPTGPVDNGNGGKPT